MILTVALSLTETKLNLALLWDINMMVEYQILQGVGSKVELKLHANNPGSVELEKR